MEENSVELCTHLMLASINEIRKAGNRMARHTALISELMNPRQKLGKALRSIKWLEEASNERELNAYGGRPKPFWNTIKKALENAHIYGDISYVTLIPGKLELHNAGDELIMEFGPGDYHRLIVELKLIIREN